MAIEQGGGRGDREWEEGKRWIRLLDLLAEGAPLREARLATSRLAQHSRAAAAEDNGLRVAEDGRDVEAARALHVHEDCMNK